MSEAKTLLELEIIHDTFVSGIHSIQIMGPNARFTFYVDQDGERVAVEKLVIAVDAIPECIRATIAATWNRLTHIPILEMAIADRVGRH